MISPYNIANSLLLRLAFFTAKSARQTTPNLIKNPRLTERGLIKYPHKSYAYEVPAHLPDRHLYWDNTAQNKLRRKEYNTHRLYKLGIRAIHDQNGNPLNNRPLEEVLYELASLKVVKGSLGRTLINLREILERFPEVLDSPNKAIVEWTLNQIDHRNLPSLGHYDFSTYCYLRQALRVPPTTRLLLHAYKWIQGEVERPTGKFKPKFFLSNLRYIFSHKHEEDLTDILYKKKIEFKLFEDLEPTNKPLEELLPKLFSDEQLRNMKADASYKRQALKFLQEMPGGQGLLARIDKA